MQKEGSKRERIPIGAYNTKELRTHAKDTERSNEEHEKAVFRVFKCLP